MSEPDTLMSYDSWFIKRFCNFGQPSKVNGNMKMEIENKENRRTLMNFIITFVSKPVPRNANQSYKNIDRQLRFVYQCSILDHGLFDKYALYWSVCFFIILITITKIGKHQTSAPLAFMEDIHRWSVNSPQKWPVTRKMLPFVSLRLFTQSFIQAQIKENINASHHWPLCGECIGDRWIQRTKGH